MRRTDRFWIFVALLSGALLAAGCRQDVDTGEAAMDVAEALSTDTTGYARADRPWSYSFPSDHGAHPEFRTEWWYYTGNLQSVDGRRFGYQFTLFRIALLPPALQIEDDGTWATHQLYMAHFAVTDAEDRGFVAEERFSRASAGLAGAAAQPYRIWLEDWEVGALDTAFERQYVRAAATDAAVDLVIEAQKPVVLHGDEGLDAKGPHPGDASYYYAVTRWSTSGAIIIDGERHEVTGTSWLDREWSTSVLGEGIRGWDWFALQLDDGRDIMYYQLRDENGEPTEFSGGVIIEPDGTKYPVPHPEATLEATGQWRSPLGGAYPSGWRLSMPGRGVSLQIDPILRQQEVDASVRYWEGAVDVVGFIDGAPVRGVGYVELTGYAESGRSQLARH